jgi:hypothetical protein
MRRLELTSTIVAIVAIMACGDTATQNAGIDVPADTTYIDISAEADGDSGEDAGEDTSGDPRPYFPGGGYVLEDSHVNVVREIVFTSVLDGVVPGFDLDGHTTSAGDEDGCGKPDLTSPSGTPGIDNQLGNVWPALAPLIGTQLEGLLQGAINEGRVLIMVELAEVDDLWNDDSVVVNVYRGLADPEVGTIGFISPNQTYDYDYGSPISTVEHVAIQDGSIVAGPFIVTIPIDILDVQTVLVIENAWIDVQIDDRGAIHGVLGGAFSVDSLLDALFDSGARTEASLIEPLLRNNADMSFGSECGHLSVAIEVEGTKAYVVRNPEQE